MKNRKGGYIIIDLEGNDLTSNSFTLEGVYERLEGNYRKAIQLTGIIIDDVEKADTFVEAKISDDDFVINVYGYNLIIDSDDLVTPSEGTALNVLMENIVDANGNNRFIEGSLTIETIPGVTKSYGKWSLSGSHLMIVLCIALADTTTLQDEANISIFDVPKFIYDKITALTSNIVSVISTINYVDNTPTDFLLLKSTTEGRFVIRKSGSYTASGDQDLRIQFDLLIDNE